MGPVGLPDRAADHREVCSRREAVGWSADYPVAIGVVFREPDAREDYITKPSFVP